MRLPNWIRQHLAAIRALLVLTVITGVIYPLAVLAVAQVPGLKAKADGSITKVNGHAVGSTLIGQPFVDKSGNPLKQYFQSRPSSASDPTNSSDPGTIRCSPAPPTEARKTSSTRSPTRSWWRRTNRIRRREPACSPRSARGALPSASSKASTDPGPSARRAASEPCSR